MVIRFALMGFGNVGRAYAKILIDKHDEIEQTAYGVYGDMLRVIEKMTE